MADKPAAQAKKKSVKAYKPAAKFCSKCGCRMADHKNRYACGKCGYTELKQQGK